MAPPLPFTGATRRISLSARPNARAILTCTCVCVCVWATPVEGRQSPAQSSDTHTNNAAASDIGDDAHALVKPFDEFTVTFNTREPLGLELTSELTVRSFRRKEATSADAHTHTGAGSQRAGYADSRAAERSPAAARKGARRDEYSDTPRQRQRMASALEDPGAALRMPAEASGRIAVGDVLVGVNGASLEGVSLTEAQTRVARANVPKRLTFRRARPPQPLSAAGSGVTHVPLATRPVGIHGHEVVIELFANDALFATLYGMQAMFGGPIKCQRGKFVRANPPSGCSAYRNAGAATDAVVLVDRGECSFSVKAAMAQQYGARALLVLNNDANEAVIRMPADPTVDVDLSLAVVMLPSTYRLKLDNYSDPTWRGCHAILHLAGQYCGVPDQMRDPTPRSWKAAVQSNGEVSARSRDGGSARSHAAGAAARGVPTGYLVVLRKEQVAEVIPEQLLRGVDPDNPEALTAFLEVLRHLLPHERLVRLEYFAGAFGAPPTVEPLRLALAAPGKLACEELTVPQPRGAPWPARMAVIAERGDCPYSTKATRAHAAGAHVLIVGNNELGMLEMQAENGSYPQQMTAVMIGQDAFSRLTGAVTSASSELYGFLLPDPEPGIMWGGLINATAPSAWPEDAAGIRKTYGRLALLHHPDASTGDADRFLLLQQLYTTMRGRAGAGESSEASEPE